MSYRVQRGKGQLVEQCLLFILLMRGCRSGKSAAEADLLWLANPCSCHGIFRGAGETIVNEIIGRSTGTSWEILRKLRKFCTDIAVVKQCLFVVYKGVPLGCRPGYPGGGGQQGEAYAVSRDVTGWSLLLLVPMAVV